MVAGRRPKRDRVHPPVGDLERTAAVAAHLEDARRRGDAELVEPVVGVHDQRPPAPRGPEDAGHDRAPWPGRSRPTSWCRARAGLVSGPEEVEDGAARPAPCGPVRRSAWRGGSAGRSRSPCPPRRTQRATPSGPSSMATPSASSTSAVPTDDEAARLPCLQTGTPAPAVMNAANVVTLMLASRSPPVPTRSTTAPVHRRDRTSPSGQGTAASTIARARPGHLLGRLPLGVQQHQERAHLGRRGLPGEDDTERLLGLVRSAEPPGRAQAGARTVGPGQSHHRSRSRTPRAIRPSCTWDVPSTIVSCLASRYHCSVGWSSM